MVMSRRSWALALGFGLVFPAFGTGLWLLGSGTRMVELSRFAQANVGGPFTLTSADGRRISANDLAGRPYALYFGFTHCPDVCPTSMFEMAAVLRDVGDAARDFPVFFVTVDPERDTPELLREYTSNFDRRIVGLTGSRDEIDATVRAFRAYYRKVPMGGDSYSMDHTAAIYLMDRSNRLFEILRHGEDHANAVAKVRRLLAASA